MIPCLRVFRFVNRRTIGAYDGHLKALLAKFLGALCGLPPCFEFGCERSSPLGEEGPNDVPHSCVPCFTHTHAGQRVFLRAKTEKWKSCSKEARDLVDHVND